MNHRRTGSRISKAYKFFGINEVEFFNKIEGELKGDKKHGGKTLKEISEEVAQKTGLSYETLRKFHSQMSAVKPDVRKYVLGKRSGMGFSLGTALILSHVLPAQLRRAMCEIASSTKMRQCDLMQMVQSLQKWQAGDFRNVLNLVTYMSFTNGTIEVEEIMKLIGCDEEEAVSLQDTMLALGIITLNVTKKWYDFSTQRYYADVMRLMDNSQKRVSVSSVGDQLVFFNKELDDDYLRGLFMEQLTSDINDPKKRLSEEMRKEIRDGYSTYRDTHSRTLSDAESFFSSSSEEVIRSVYETLRVLDPATYGRLYDRLQSGAIREDQLRALSREVKKGNLNGKLGIASCRNMLLAMEQASLVRTRSKSGDKIYELTDTGKRVTHAISLAESGVRN
ncbi:MAG: hypothetical protein JRN52_06515 [Nitrososphaerota archaeon]|nr:hypothetical protein [Nitrososphaerota archaeon]